MGLNYSREREFCLGCLFLKQSTKPQFSVFIRATVVHSDTSLAGSSVVGNTKRFRSRFMQTVGCVGWLASSHCCWTVQSYVYISFRNAIDFLPASVSNGCVSSHTEPLNVTRFTVCKKDTDVTMLYFYGSEWSCAYVHCNRWNIMKCIRIVFMVVCRLAVGVVSHCYLKIPLNGMAY